MLFDLVDNPTILLVKHTRIGGFTVYGGTGATSARWTPQVAAFWSSKIWVSRTVGYIISVRRNLGMKFEIPSTLGGDFCRPIMDFFETLELNLALSIVIAYKQ